MILRPGNIWSGNRQLAVFTNPTELAFRKGNLKHHYPIVFCGDEWPDVEAAYQQCRNPKWDLNAKLDLMSAMIERKLVMYPLIAQTISNSGGALWIAKCSHFTGARTKRFQAWEGKGLHSLFIFCLHQAYIAWRQKGAQS